MLMTKHAGLNSWLSGC